MAKLLLGDDLQNVKLNEETAQQILSHLRSPMSIVTHNLTQPILQYLYDRSVNQVVTHCRVLKPSSQAVHIAPADSDFDKLLVELLPMGTQSQTVGQPQY